MSYILISVSIYIVSVIVHVLIHRILRLMGIRTFKTTTVFIIGFLVNSAVAINGSFLFALLSILHIIFYTSPFLGDESPVTKIVELLRVNKRMSFQRIAGAFSDTTLVVKRLKDLERSGLIEIKNNRYFVTNRGKKLFNLIDVYRKFLHWDRGG